MQPRYDSFLGVVVPMPDDDLGSVTAQHETITGEFDITAYRNGVVNDIVCWPIGSYIRECEEVGLSVEPQGIQAWVDQEISHVAFLLVGDPKADDAHFMVGPRKITKQAELVLFSEKRGKYRMQHCPDCVMAMLYWLIMMQEKWNEKFVAVPEGPRAYN